MDTISYICPGCSLSFGHRDWLLRVFTGFIENHRLDHKKDDKFVVQFAKLRVQIDIKAIQLVFPVFIT